MESKQNLFKFRDIAQKTDSEGRRYWSVYGPIAISGEIDTQNEAAKSADEVRQLAWEWFRSDRTGFVDTQHDYAEKDAQPVESHIIQREGYPDEVAWMARVNVYDTAIGEKIDSGNFNGFSWAGPYSKAPFLVLVKHPLEASGTTEKSDAGPYPEHEHGVPALKFDDDAKPVACKTAMAWGHSHAIRGTTRTERTDGHSHPIVIETKSREAA